jgi:putative hydrolase of the HAD superfamily
LKRIWLFDLDDTLHDAANASMPGINAAMTAYVQRELQFSRDEADALRQRYWRRYGATLLGLIRHHGVKAAHFLHDTHRLPGLEQRVRGHRHDFAAIARLRGSKLILTNAPRAYALRVLRALRIEPLFDAVLSIEDMVMFGRLRPKPDTRMLRALCARLRVHPTRCVLVEDTLRHQKAARRVGMRTVWMRRYRRRDESAARAPRRPPYVDLLARSLKVLQAFDRRPHSAPSRRR